jgi:hypothetical protein
MLMLVPKLTLLATVCSQSEGMMSRHHALVIANNPMVKLISASPNGQLCGI